MSKTSTNSYAAEKNEQNLSLYQYIANTIPTLLPGWYFPPTSQQYTQGTLANGTSYTEYTFTVPLKCQYFKVLLVGAGGHGGSEDATPSTLSWVGGGGGAGAWARLLVPKSVFIAGVTQFKIRVGHEANASASWQDAKGGDTVFLTSGGTPLVTAVGGDSGQNNVFEGPGGAGGTISGTTYLIESGRGQTGQDGQHHYQSLLISDKVISGMGGTSAFGDAGIPLVKGTGGWDNGKRANHYGAGGSGCIHNMNLPGNPTLYGGNGAGGFASVEFYYQ